MTDFKLSLSWDTYQKSICNGLGMLQQRGEFVDMTIAADGHYVKVHQMVLSLVSPYIKEIVTTTPSSHPVIFLNKVSYQTLELILEYAYTGEVLVSKYALKEFLEACTALRIKGLENEHKNVQFTADVSLLHDIGASNIHTVHPQRKETTDSEQPFRPGVKRKNIDVPEVEIGDSSHYENIQTYDDSQLDTASLERTDTVSLDGTDHETSSVILPDRNTETVEVKKKKKQPPVYAGNSILYTLSIMDKVELLLERHIYIIQSRRKNGSIKWRCCEHRRNGCQAYVVVKDKRKLILERECFHNHRPQDDKISKKVEEGNIFKDLIDARNMVEMKKQIKDPITLV